MPMSMNKNECSMIASMSLIMNPSERMSVSIAAGVNLRM